MTYPRVSIIVLAFNQEAFVQAAIDSVLAQDYANLEVVLSDDGSSDATFEIMKRAQRDYTGPHTIVVNRTSANRGILSHLYDAVSRSSGRFIVAAGGDDISVPQRVSRLVETWLDTGADAVFSTCTLIDANGNRTSDGMIWLERTMQSYFPGRRAYKITGAMAGYDRRVFDAAPLPDEPVWCEDVFLSLMIHYRGGTIVPLDERLVLYRSHEDSLTNVAGGKRSIEIAETKAIRLAHDLGATLGRFQALVESDVERGDAKSDVDLNAVRKMRLFYEFSEKWMSMPLVERLRRAVIFRSSEQRRWVVPRLFGLPMFVRIKALQQLIRPAR